jgi:Activator of Hsp90 ATPase homolog 1-like protein.
MKKQKINVERGLTSRSLPLIWKYISSPEGLRLWIAEQVEQEGDVLVFTWGKPGQVYETRRADILDVQKHEAIRFKWEDEDEEEAYTEIAVAKLDVTDDYVLSITDFSDPDDIDGMKRMWNHDLDRLHYKTGL